MPINLPGHFRSFPNGPKPKGYAPHAQPTISAARAVERTHHKMEASSPPAREPRHSIEAFRAPDRAPRHNITEARRADPSPRHNITEARRADPSPRHNIRPFEAPDRAPRHNIEPFQPPERAPRHQIEPFQRPARAARHNIEQREVEDRDPYGNYYFELELNGQTVAHFMECSGLKNASEVFEINEGGLNSGTHKRPGQSKWENISLKYGTSDNMDLLRWRDSYLMGNYKSRAGSSGSKQSTGCIKVKNNAGEVVRVFEFTGAWPVSWEGPALNAGGSELAIETLEIAHDGLTVKDS
jgi:phage tail-like protein